MQAKVTLLIIALLLGTNIKVMAFGNCSDALKSCVHEEITMEALSFLKPSVRIGLATWNADVNSRYGGWNHDTRTAHAWHFDNCLFREASQNINASYGIAVVAFNPDAPNVGIATEWFGRLLHPAQDFYSHSNWVDLGKTELIDDGLEFWTTLTPFRTVKGVKVVQGEHFEEPYIPSNVTLSLAERTVSVGTPDGEILGLISGLSGWWLTDDDCPDEVTIDHDELNKDLPNRPNYSQARRLAQLQTTHEWCRLANLVRQSYGQRGLRSLFDNWVEDERAAISACLDAQAAQIIHVDHTFAGSPELGTQENPFRQFRDGTNAIWRGGTVIIHPGRYPANGAYVTPMILRSIEGEAVLEGSP